MVGLAFSFSLKVCGVIKIGLFLFYSVDIYYFMFLSYSVQNHHDRYDLEQKYTYEAIQFIFFKELCHEIDWLIFILQCKVAINKNSYRRYCVANLGYIIICTVWAFRLPF